MKLFYSKCAHSSQLQTSPRVKLPPFRGERPRSFIGCRGKYSHFLSVLYFNQFSPFLVETRRKMSSLLVEIQYTLSSSPVKPQNG